MSEGTRSVDLVLIWHHHQPDYRRPADHCAMLPWVRLHAAKDYLDMALRLERHPKLHSTFNFVPSLLDQMEDVGHGTPDALFDLLRRPPAELNEAERAEVLTRCSLAPRHALDRWPSYRTLIKRVSAGTERMSPQAGERDLLALESWFLLAWLDPMFLTEPEAAAALAAAPRFEAAHRDGLLVLHDRLVAGVVPAYRKLAEAGQVELAESPYYHPILPLLLDVRFARRCMPGVTLPHENFSAPEDARGQIDRAMDRHARAFGSRPAGMWPPEGSVSPEAAALAVRAGLSWIASDEGVLWQSLEGDARRRESLYRPWRFTTDDGEIALFFRDHELSDRLGFVYQNWRTEDAVGDFLERVRRVAREQPADSPAVVTVILDGENCWEYYPDDGGPFLEALYNALEAAPDIRTRTPSEVLAELRDLPALPRLATGSWIDADFHIWIGHPEKNRAWDLLSRARRALVERNLTFEGNPAAWESLFAAEGSDWFWWFGEDHFTADKALFDRLFRSHLQAVYERAGLAVPAWLDVPVSRMATRIAPDREPLGLIQPVIDGRRTGYYEWHGAGHFRLGAGGSMHHGTGHVSDVYYGFDRECLFLRLDFPNGAVPGDELDLGLDLLSPVAARLLVRGLGAGVRVPIWSGGERDGQPVAGAKCAVGKILELALPFASLGLVSSNPVEIVCKLLREGRPVENLPPDDLLRFRVPDERTLRSLWSA